jgi:hypothetical protein
MLGTMAAVIFILLAVWRWNLRKRGLPPSATFLDALLAVLALVYQGSLGGAMLFGK